MTLLVDTYNVLHVVGVLPDSLAGINVAGLAKLIGLSRYRGKKSFLVCDGVSGAKTSLPDQIQVVFSGSKLTADQVIVAKVLAASYPRQITVVTSDRAIQRAVRRRKAKTIPSPDFLEHLVADAENANIQSKGAQPKPSPKGPLSETAIEAWAQYLDIDLEQFDLSELAPPSPAKVPKPQSTPAPPPSKPAQKQDGPKYVRAQPDFPPDILAEARRLLEEKD